MTETAKTAEIAEPDLPARPDADRASPPNAAVVPAPAADRPAPDRGRRWWLAAPAALAVALTSPARARAQAQAQTARAGQPGPPGTSSAPGAPGAPVRSLAVLDFELIDEQQNPLTVAAQTVRLRLATAQLQQDLAERRLYRVADLAAGRALLRQLREQQAYLYRCDDCIVQVGRRLGVDLVMSTWVQKVSELILNVNVQIHDVASERLVFTKSVDMRGNDDVSWTRAVRFLVRDMAEKRERNPRYGQ